jgi:hypothetical protein
LAAAEIRNTYEDYQKTIKYKPDCDPNKGINTEGCFYQAPKPTIKKAYPCDYPRQCVCYVKQIVGVYGTWGDGGWMLSDNSDPMVGVAIIFNYTHIGWITQFDGYNIGYTHQIEGKGILYTWTTINDPTIWKYHKF